MVLALHGVMMTQGPGGVPEVGYARSGDVSIAYQVVGGGPIDVLLAPGFPSHLEHAWEQPRLAHYYRRLASFSRLILLDKRGTGLSDRVPDSDLPGVERRMDDIRAVLDSVGAKRAAIVGVSDGGPIAAVFAATYPDRALSLVLVNSYARRLQADDYPWAPTAEQWEAFRDEVRGRYGGPIFLDIIAPSLADDPEFAEWWGAFMRRSVSPGAALAYLKMNAEIDVRAALPAVRVPTLVAHSVGDQICPVDGGRYLADHIPGAVFLELPGRDHQPWISDGEQLADRIEEFLTGQRPGPVPASVLGTLLFTDVVRSTETAAELGDQKWSALLETFLSAARAELARHQGREIKTTGDGFLALFDGPARAVRAALAIQRTVAPLGVRLRAGVHTSEIEVTDDDVRGLGVHVAARIMALAEPGQVLVSSVVRDLAVGSGLTLTDRGTHELKGVPGSWQVLAAAP